MAERYLCTRSPSIVRTSSPSPRARCGQLSRRPLCVLGRSEARPLEAGLKFSTANDTPPSADKYLVRQMPHRHAVRRHGARWTALANQTGAGKPEPLRV